MAQEEKPSPWWSGDRHADTRPFLAARSAITKATRAWFDDQGFVEIETSILQVSPGNETHLHAAAHGARRRRWRAHDTLLADLAGIRLQEIAGRGRNQDLRTCPGVPRPRARHLHLPEFTMLEWYRANATYDAVMADSVVIVAHAAQATGIGRFSFRGRTADPFAEPELLTVATAFERFAGIDLLATVADGQGDRESLAAVVGQQVRITADDTWSDIFSKVLVEHIEPNLGQGRLTLLFEYPVPEAALARAKPSDPRVAERFEIYACGVELANGFGELTNASEQRRRFMLAMDEKQRRYGERYPLDEDFLGGGCAHAGSKRRCAWFRSAGDAGERLHHR